MLQAIFEYDGQKEMISCFNQQIQTNEDIYIEKEQFESLIDVFVASADLQLDDSMMKDGPLTLETLVTHESV